MQLYLPQIPHDVNSDKIRASAQIAWNPIQPGYLANMLREKKTEKHGTILDRVKNGWSYISSPQHAFITNYDNLMFIYIKLRQIKTYLINLYIWTEVWAQTPHLGFVVFYFTVLV
jgi:hypothetical protein